VGRLSGVRASVASVTRQVYGGPRNTLRSHRLLGACPRHLAHRRPLPFPALPDVRLLRSPDARTRIPADRGRLSPRGCPFPGFRCPRIRCSGWCPRVRSAWVCSPGVRVQRDRSWFRSGRAHAFRPWSRSGRAATLRPWSRSGRAATLRPWSPSGRAATLRPWSLSGRAATLRPWSCCGRTFAFGP
jgi:hypothetical protein